MAHNFLKETKPIRLKIDGANWEMAAGNGDTLNSASVDSQQCTETTFLLFMGAIVSGGTPTLQVQGSNDNATWVNITNATQSLTTANATQVVPISVYKPAYRYLRLQTVRGGGQNATIDALFVVQKNITNIAPALDPSIVTPVILNNP